MDPRLGSIVTVLMGDGGRAGMGFLLDDERVCTAAHVVNDALGRDFEEAAPPSGEIKVRLGSSRASHRAARVDAWWPPGGGTTEDVAVLRLEESCSQQPALLGAADDRAGAKLSVFGYPRGSRDGAWIDLELVASRPNGTIQMRSADPLGYRVEPGFSGAPVWSQRGRVVGMVVSAERDPASPVAFMLPAEQLQALVDDGPIRSKPPWWPLGEGVTRNLAALEGFFYEYIGGTDSAVAFGGREDKLAELDEWAEGDAPPHGLLVAEAGRGKSALLAQWAVRAARRGVRVAFLPVSIRFNTADRYTAMGLLGEQLRHLIGASGDLPSDPEEWALEVETVLREDDPRPLVVIIDGADEVVGWTLSRNLKLPHQLGRGRRILISARITGDRDAQGWAQAFNWSSYSSISLPRLDLDGVREALSQLGDDLDTHVEEEIFRLSEGDPLLVHLYADALKADDPRSWSPGRLPDVDPGLRGYFERWWQEQHRIWTEEGRDPNQGRSEVDALLSYLAVCLGPIRREELLGIGAGQLPSGLALGRVVEEVGRLVIGDGVDNGYVLGHPRLREYFLRELDRATVDDLRRRFIAHGEVAMQALADGASPTEWEYAIRHQGSHLVEAGASLHNFEALLNGSWMQAWGALDNTLDGYRDEVDRVWAAAIEEDALPIQMRAALFMSSLTSSGVPLPDNVLGGLVAGGLWTTGQALGYLRGLPRAVERAHAVAAIAAHLSTSDAESMAGLSAELRARERVDFVVALAPSLPLPQARRLAKAARAAAAETREEQMLTYADGLLARFLDPVQLEGRKLLSDIPEMGDQSMRARVILEVYEAGRIEDQDALSLARAFTTPVIRARVLGQIGIEAGDGDAVSEALVAAGAIAEPAAWAETIAALARKGVPIPADEVELLRVVTPSEARADVSRRLLALLDLVDPSRRQEVLDEATNAIRDVADPSTRAALLAELAANVSASARKGLLQEALSLSRRIDDGAERAASIAALVADCRELPTTTVETAIGTVDPKDPPDSPVYLAKLLGRVSPSAAAVTACLDALLESDPKTRARGLDYLVPLMDEQMVLTAWAALLADLRSPVRQATLSRIAAGHAMLLFSQSDNRRHSGEAIALLIPHLSERYLAAVLVQVEGLLNPAESALCLGMIAARLESGNEAELARRAIGRCRAVLMPSTRRRVLLEIASSLLGSARQEVVAALVVDLRRSGHDLDQHETISALADSGFGAEIPNVVDLAQKIDDPALRPTALAIAGEIDAAEAAAEDLTSPTARAISRARIASGLEATDRKKAAAEALVALDDSVAGLLIAQNSSFLDAENLPVVVDRAARIRGGFGRRLALSALCRRVDEIGGDAFVLVWPRLLRVLASRRRPELLRDLRVAVPGGVFDDEVLIASVEAIQEVGRELP